MLFALGVVGYFMLGFILFCLNAYFSKRIEPFLVFAYPLVLFLFLILGTREALVWVGKKLGGKEKLYEVEPW